MPPVSTRLLQPAPLPELPTSPSAPIRPPQQKYNIKGANRKNDGLVDLIVRHLKKDGQEEHSESAMLMVEEAQVEEAEGPKYVTSIFRDLV